MGLDLAGAAARIVQDDEAVDASSLRQQVARIGVNLRAAAPGRVALCSARADRVIAALLACADAGVELVLLRRLPDAQVLASWGIGAVLQDDGTAAPVDGAASAAPQGFALMLTTSGTTGVPKVARHDVQRLLGRIRPPQSDAAPPVWLLAYHPASFAGMQVLLSWLVGGGTLVACAGSAVATLAAACLRHRVSHISATPTFWRALLMTLGHQHADLPLRQATLGGERVDQAVLDRLRSLYPTAGLTHIYASTEAGALFAVRDCRAGFPARWLGEGVDGVELRLQHGRLEVRSPRAMRGYLEGTGRSPLTEDGWLNTNDRAEIQGDRIQFLGRLDAVISVGGANVSPDEVEGVLQQAAGVADIRVSGARNAISGHVVCAELVVQPGFDAAEVRQRVLALARARLEHYQVPRIVRVVSSIEYSETGKKIRT